MATTTVSSPGKALIAGGYLVLESPNPGLVLAADKRFHCTVTNTQPPAGSTDADGNDGDNEMAKIALDVYSPQFDVIYQYWVKYSTKDEGEKAVLRLSPRDESQHSSNTFIERTLLLTLSFIRESLGSTKFHEELSSLPKQEKALAVKLRADNDFYSLIPHLQSRNLESTSQNVSSLPDFLPCPKVKDETTGEEKLVVNKTGMGSSAALVTSLVGALLAFFKVVSLPHSTSSSSAEKKKEDGLKIAHNLAQICHCHAQGKVGSGFDVSSAVYGSHIYTRFSKGVIAALLEEFESSSSSALSISKELSKELFNSVMDVEKTWDSSVKPFSLPSGLELLMADVCGGSESPSMARKILAWKKESSEKENYWTNLEQINRDIQSLFATDLSPSSAFQSWFQEQEKSNRSNVFASRTAAQWKGDVLENKENNYTMETSEIAKTLLTMRDLFIKARTNLRCMGEAASVPVEPPEQEELADATMKLPGVIIAGVPGAGGYDALFVLYVKGVGTGGIKSAEGFNDVCASSDEVRDKIGELWKTWGGENGKEGGGVSSVCPLAVRAAGSGGVHGLCETDLGW